MTGFGYGHSVSHDPEVDAALLYCGENYAGMSHRTFPGMVDLDSGLDDGRAFFDLDLFGRLVMIELHDVSTTIPEDQLAILGIVQAMQEV